MDDKNTLPIIDWELAVKLAGGQTDLAKDILALFIKNLPNNISEIKQLYIEQNYEELKLKLHKFHGALCYCGLPRLKMLVVQLETNLKNNIMVSLPSLLDQIEIEVKRLLEHYPNHLAKRLSVEYS